MKITVVNGSPAGKDSITLQTVEYIRRLFPGHEWDVLHAGQQIRAMERDFSGPLEALRQADLILFAYPVYTFLAPAQLHRFLELVRESGADLSGKTATQVTTSKHFYDMTAHRFIRDTCADLGIRTVRGLSADMEDLLSKQGQADAEAFFRYVLWCMENGVFEPVPRPAGTPGSRRVTASVPDGAGASGPARVALVTDLDPADPEPALDAMIRRFEKRMEGTCEVINLREFPFAGGCLGCFHCAADGTCVYRDGFDSFLRTRINGADAVVYAFTVKDHSMGYRFKLYDDRQFCNGHRTVTMGKPVGYLVDGDLAGEENLRILIEARAEVGGNFLAGAATDAEDPDGEVDKLAAALAYAVRSGYTPPKNFYGVGGMKIFRDLIYQMQGLMREDHRFYREHGFYDFPQRKKGRIAAMYLVSLLMRSKRLMKKSRMTMTDGMLMPYRKTVEKAAPADGAGGKES